MQARILVKFVYVNLNFLATKQNQGFRFDIDLGYFAEKSFFFFFEGSSSVVTLGGMRNFSRRSRRGDSKPESQGISVCYENLSLELYSAKSLSLYTNC